MEISRSEYYDWLGRRPSARDRSNQALRRRLTSLHDMGLNSLHHMLKPEFACSRKRVHRQMQIAGISSARSRAYKATTIMAYRRRKLGKGIIFHSNRGVQYAARAYWERLEAYGIRQSMSRKGDPYDNAVAENFFSCLKCELIHLKHYPTHRSAQNDVFAYLETFYNTLGPHSAMGWISPARVEAKLRTSVA